jgi:hypothetical protein
MVRMPTHAVATLTFSIFDVNNSLLSFFATPLMILYVSMMSYGFTTTLKTTIFTKILKLLTKINHFHLHMHGDNQLFLFIDVHEAHFPRARTQCQQQNEQNRREKGVVARFHCSFLLF